MEDLRERWIKMLKEVQGHCASIPASDDEDVDVCKECELDGVCMLNYGVCPMDWDLGEEHERL